jgi:hypothetical protein
MEQKLFLTHTSVFQVSLPLAGCIKKFSDDGLALGLLVFGLPWAISWPNFTASQPDAPSKINRVTNVLVSTLPTAFLIA